MGNKAEEEKIWYKRRVSFLLYIKLSTLLAVTWVFGLVASIMDMPSLWYPFIILNSLQGTFIFVFFDLKWRVYYTAYEKLTGKSHPDRRRRKRKPSRLLKCLRSPEYVRAETNERRLELNVRKSVSKENSTEKEESKIKTQGFGKFKSKSILVKNALRLKTRMPSPSKKTQEENIEGLNAWQQLKIFQKSFSDANSAKDQDEEKRQKRRGMIARQRGFEIEEDDDAPEPGFSETIIKKKDPKRLLASTDSEESTIPRKKMRRKKRRSQRRKSDVEDKVVPETKNCSELGTLTLASLPPPYRPPPEYRTLSREVMLEFLFLESSLVTTDSYH